MSSMTVQPPNTVWVPICPVSEIDPQAARGFSINGQPLVAVRWGDGDNVGVNILQGTCSHMYYPLKDSPVAECMLTCRLHHSRFDVRDGSVQEWGTFPPLIGAALDAIRQSKMLRQFPVRIEDGIVYIRWPGEDPSAVRVKL